MHNVLLSNHPPVKNKKRKKHLRKPGRPKGYSLKRFDQTRIGFLLAHEVPIEYKLLMETVKSLKLSSPSAELIEAIAYAVYLSRTFCHGAIFIKIIGIAVIFQPARSHGAIVIKIIPLAVYGPPAD